MVPVQDTGGLPPWAQVLIVLAGFIALVTKQIVPGWFYKELKQENQELKADNKHLVELMLETQKATLPALEAGTAAVKDAMDEIRYLRRKDG